MVSALSQLSNERSLGLSQNPKDETMPVDETIEHLSISSQPIRPEIQAAKSNDTLEERK
jgi:hypothetical protein